jgi:hypothetical protein
MVHLTVEALGELKITRNVRDEIYLIRRWKQIHHWSLPGGSPCSSTGEWGRLEDTSDGDPGVGGDPDGADGGVLALLGVGLSFTEG